MIGRVRDPEEQHEPDDRHVAVLAREHLARGKQGQRHEQADVEDGRGPEPTSAENSTASRAAPTRRTAPATACPAIGSRPVQFGIAVSRKPETAAPTKPNSISCRCHATGSNRVGRLISPASTKATARWRSPPRSHRRRRTAETRREGTGASRPSAPLTQREHLLARAWQSLPRLRTEAKLACSRKQDRQEQ